MFSKILNKALEKLELKDTIHQASAKADELLYPTLSFPSPPRGTRSLCARCLTLLSHFVTHYGDGTDFKPLEITHSSAIRDFSHVVQSNNTTPKKTSECVICVKVFILFKTQQVEPAHAQYEDSWRRSPSTDSSLIWRANTMSYDPKYTDRLYVKLRLKHKGGHESDLGCFELYPDSGGSAEISSEKKNVDEALVIGPLDAHDDSTGRQPSFDSSSTLSAGTLSIVSSWTKECVANHVKCRRIFGSDGSSQPEAWFPDRLIQVKRKEGGGLTARLVLKSNLVDSQTSNSKQLQYVSLSHCWGLPPNPLAPLGGRADSVLTEQTLPKWTASLPVNDLPPAFRHAMDICACLDFEYIWIDSLCILQDSRKDWETQSAVMGDVYKFAFLNIAALASKSDYDGFIFSRDTRVIFGWRCSFAKILGRNATDFNQDGKRCILLKGMAAFSWNYSGDIPGSNVSNTPLFTRAWVYQERSLARRTLAFANASVSWFCDEHSLHERPGWHAGASEDLRKTQHSVVEAMNIMSQNGVNEQLLRDLIQKFDKQWACAVVSYTLCNLTKHTDKLVAISSVARELANTKILPSQRYLAGFWDIGLLSQLGWINIYGNDTPPRAQVGEEGYVAPSWSWASVESTVQVRNIFPSTSFPVITLASVLGADVELATSYQFGSVKAGWMRLRGHLNRVNGGEWVGTTNSLTDEVTGEKFWFCSDTIEGFEIIRRGRARSLVWMPLRVNFHSILECNCLVLMEVEGTQYGGPKGFVRRGERVYRRLGTGNFGRLTTMLKPNDLVLTLGTYPSIQAGEEGQGERLAKGFKPKQTGMQEFVLI